METKEIKGITLITLAITIVVLIILAGVSINAVISDDGIIKKAQNSANLTKEAEVKEAINRTILEFYLTNDYETLEDFLKAKVTEGKIDSVTKNADATLTVKKGDYSVTVENKTNSSGGSGSGGSTGGETQTPEITIGEIKVVADSTGTGSAITDAASVYLGNTLYITFSHSITGGTTTVDKTIPYAITKNGTYTFTVTGTVNGKSYTKNVSVTVNQFKTEINLDDVQIGDSVNYTYDDADNYVLASSYSGCDSSQTIAQDATLTWKVMNIDKENNTIEIISANPTDSTVSFSGILGYNNGPYLMNEICKAQYSNETLGLYARNINLLDMEKHLTETGISIRNAYIDSRNPVQYGNTQTYMSKSYRYYPKLYANQIGAGINTTSVAKPDITKGNDPYKLSEPISTTEPTTDSSYGQATSSGLTVTETFYSMNINDTNYGKVGNVLANNMSFWMAARYITTDKTCAIWGLHYVSTFINGDSLFVSNNRPIGGRSLSLRPIVSLQSRSLTGKKTNGAWDLNK